MPRCKECGVKFKPVQFLQKYCKGNDDCLAAEGMYMLDKFKKTKAKEQRKETKAMKESLLTHKDYIKMLQVVFNTYIRTRDKDLPCISCDTMANVKYDAGHFYPTTYQYLRFNEDNVHKQCSNNCNLHKSGNFQEYAPRLEIRIGFERVQKLHHDRHKRLELSIPELKELIKEYKFKTKQLNK